MSRKGARNCVPFGEWHITPVPTASGSVQITGLLGAMLIILETRLVTANCDAQAFLNIPIQRSTATLMRVAQRSFSLPASITACLSMPQVICGQVEESDRESSDTPLFIQVDRRTI